MGAVWWATRTEWKELATLRLSAIPTKYTIATIDPSPANKQLRIRFDDSVTIKQSTKGDHISYDLYFSEQQNGFKIQFDLIFKDRSVQICEIFIQRAPSKLESALREPSKFIAIGNLTKNAPIEFKFRDGYVDELLAKYQLDKTFKGDANACVQIEYLDGERIKPLLVDDIYFVEANALKRLNAGASQGDLALLTQPFQGYARRFGAKQPPTALREETLEPPKEAPSTAIPPPPQPVRNCAPMSPQVENSYTTIMQTGVIGNEDLKAVYEN
jgi:hypothetical protein